MRHEIIYFTQADLYAQREEIAKRDKRDCIIFAAVMAFITVSIIATTLYSI